MNKLLARYNDKSIMENWAIKPNKLSFNNRDELINYLSSLKKVAQLGSFICVIDGTEYLLEVEPWAEGCLGQFLNSWKKKEVHQKIERYYLKAHMSRLEEIPDFHGYLPKTNIPGFEDVIVGISYALVKI